MADHLRLGDSPFEDAELLEHLITAARQWVEDYTRRRLAVQTLELVLDSFPGVGFLLHPPVHEVVSLKYLDTDNVERTLDPSGYVLDDASDQHWVVPAYGTDWPDTYLEINAVRLRYITGYTGTGDSPDTYPLPGPLRAAMLLIIGDLYENREAAIVGVSYTPNPALERLLSMWRLEVGI